MSGFLLNKPAESLTGYKSTGVCLKYLVSFKKSKLLTVTEGSKLAFLCAIKAH